MIPSTRSRLAAVGRPLSVFITTAALLVVLLAAARPGLAQSEPLPPAPPDAAVGLELYAQRCANCHGESGGGDGEIAGSLPARPKAFDAAYLRATQPSVMYDQITNGNAAVAMPPFGPASSNPINEQNRWDLVGALYALGTPAQMLIAGEEVYLASCADCHGVSGLGDGPNAAADGPAPTNLTDVGYWFSRSTDDVVQALAPGAIPAHNYALAEAELLSVADFSRTFSYGYVEPAALDAPIPIASVMGQITNGSTGETITEGDILLRAFTPDFNESLTLTTTVNAAGGYQFDLTDVPPDWVFIATTRYKDLSFSSDASQISRSAPELSLPISVFEQTTDTSAINLGQLHVVLEFAAERVLVNELYVVNNSSNAVYVGPTGNADNGVFEVALPAGIENLTFRRSFGDLSTSLPATDLIETERGWADPQPLGPGNNALTLLVQYELPYESGMSIAHPVYYETASTTVILPDVGVEVANTPWVAGEPQDFGQGQTFLNYIGPGVRPDETITMRLEGRPSLVTDTATGAAAVNRNQTTELIIGGTALLAVASGGIFYWLSQRQQQRAYEAYDDEYDDAEDGLPAENADDLLREIAELDAAFEAGGLDETAYQQQRAALKRRLAAVWGR